MLTIILSHWATYVYVAYVLILVVLCIVYRPRPSAIVGKLRQLRARYRVKYVTPMMRRRQFR